MQKTARTGTPRITQNHTARALQQRAKLQCEGPESKARHWRSRAGTVWQLLHLVILHVCWRRTEFLVAFYDLYNIRELSTIQHSFS
jgi:hypothetical protein